MTISIVVRLAGAVAIVVCVTDQGTSVQAQQRGGTAETEKVQPGNRKACQTCVTYTACTQNLRKFRKSDSGATGALIGVWLQPLGFDPTVRHHRE